ncbi:MAG: enoyl-CoA hydratase/isomerase family protein [Archaeoglobaceae archaeon]|nr:enoyl-CoA hydratase/isomerase family protein [Archaeoglobaceae archaeon]MDW7989054.1 enoyl-CoA hydratase/isomerase family protein [Archaeoglobaceae archaeon]
MSVDLEFDEKIAWIFLRDSDMNVLSYRLLKEIYGALLKADEKSSAIVISTRTKNFCAGADLRELKSLNFEKAIKWFESYLDVVRFLRSVGKPTIAAVRGFCVAGGNEIAMACDLVIASKNAKFGQPEVRVGSTAMGLGVQMLPLLIGEKKARELLLTGRIIDAEEAYRIGLINKVVEDGELEKTAKEVSLEIIENCSPQAFRVIKSGLNFWTQLAMVNYEVSRDLTSLIWLTSEFRDRCDEFLHKKKFNPRNFFGITH